MQRWSALRKRSRQVRRLALAAKPWPAARRAAATQLHNSGRVGGSSNSSSGAVGRRRQAGT